MTLSDFRDGRVTLDLYWDDYNQYTEQCKGKGRVGEVSDYDLTVVLWKEELQSLGQSLSDHELAVSMSNALTTDQHMIAEAQKEETQYDQDHALALSLSEDAELIPPYTSTLSEPEIKDVETESVCEVLSALAQMSMTERQEISVREGYTVGGSSSANNCVSCMETIEVRPLYSPGCGHQYCNDCLRHIFLAATKDEELYPPRCCKNIFPPGIALRLLSYRELTVFSSRGVEFSCSDRTYCGDPVCSTFIPPWEIRDQRAKCPRCQLITHTKCKALFDVNHECTLDEALQRVLSLGKAEHWSRCPHCRTLVELGQGCNHITCR